TEPVTEPVTEPETEPVTEPETEPVLTGDPVIGPDYPTDDPAGSFRIKINIAGDTQLADNYNNTRAPFAKRWAESTPDWFLGGVKEIFEGDDLTILNLECVISDLDNLTRRSKEGTAYWYRGYPEYLDILKAGSVEAVSIANNHTYDYLEAGYQDTQKHLREAGIMYSSDQSTLYFEKNGYTIALICEGMWSYGQRVYILDRLKKAEPLSDFQIVYWHGGVEYSHAPEQWQVNASHDLVDAGADLVIGTHAHVLQPMEVYNGVTIVYSLGNFCYGGMVTCENRTIIYHLELLIGADGILADIYDEIIPCYVYTANTNNFRPAPITDEDEKSRVFEFMNGLRKSPV
ncbi:MAG: CapA family protein, partial [Clostridia bacterium]|nr:CapA family protein [Clostridia bacterium]